MKTLLYIHHIIATKKVFISTLRLKYLQTQNTINKIQIYMHTFLYFGGNTLRVLF